MTTQTVTVDGEIIALDVEGYLVSLADWSPSVAAALAASEGRELTPDHWEVIDLMRAFYQRYEAVPAMRPLVKAMRQSLGEDKASSLYLMRLFPGSDSRETPAKIVARLAGLPKPTNCL